MLHCFILTLFQRSDFRVMQIFHRTLKKFQCEEQSLKMKQMNLDMYIAGGINKWRRITLNDFLTQ